ncbi:MAG: acyl carrier protein [Lachnospiraceae bacterium]|nr:acyl carrier protein [Lachnospiraceae bacterium]
MTLKEVQQEIYDVIQTSTETECVISDDKCLGADLGLSSMEVFILLGDLENNFGITIPAEYLREIQTVGDLSKLIIQILREM